MKTQVCITVDVEFSIAGAFAAPDRYSPLADEPVECLVDGKEHGLGFILDSLARYDATATFFTETLQTAYFGDAPMAKFAKRIANAGAISGAGACAAVRQKRLEADIPKAPIVLERDETDVRSTRGRLPDGSGMT